MPLGLRASNIASVDAGEDFFFLSSLAAAVPAKIAGDTPSSESKLQRFIFFAPPRLFHQGECVRSTYELGLCAILRRIACVRPRNKAQG